MKSFNELLGFAVLNSPSWLMAILLPICIWLTVQLYKRLKPKRFYTGVRSQRASRSILQAGTTITGTENDPRNALYTRIQAVQDSAPYQSAVQSADFAQVVSLSDLSSEEIAQRAVTDIAYRYALVNLTPFAFVTADAALYAPHVASGELAPETFTAEYLADRAYMLDRLLLRNRIDGTVSGEVREEFRDVETGVLFHIDAANASPARQYVFGGMIGDTITGLAADDRLYGGGGGDDVIYGGGHGSVLFDGASLIGGSQIVEGIWRSADKAFTYVFDSDFRAGRDTDGLNSELADYLAWEKAA